MKSKLPHTDRRSPAPTARLWAIAYRDLDSVPRMALVASTAVNSETMVPMPSTKANPCTPPTAMMNRMNATMNVTTLASMIAARPLR